MCCSSVLANFKLCEQVAVLAWLDLSQCMSQGYAELYYFLSFTISRFCYYYFSYEYYFISVLYSNGTCEKITVCFYDQ